MVRSSILLYYLKSSHTVALHVPTLENTELPDS